MLITLYLSLTDRAMEKSVALNVHLQSWKNGWLYYPKVLDTYQHHQGWKQVNFLFTSEKNDGKWPDEGILSALAEVNGPREITHPTCHHLVIGPPLMGFSL